MIRARAFAVPASKRVAVPEDIRHSDPSLLSFPSPSREIRFEIKDGVSRLVISVISGTFAVGGLVARGFGNPPSTTGTSEARTPEAQRSGFGSTVSGMGTSAAGRPTQGGGFGS